MEKLKVVIIGETNVGKSSLTDQFIENYVTWQHQSTIGFNFKSKQFVYDNETVILNIWDTAGQERFQTVVAMYYRNCDLAIIVYDVTSRSSFDEITKWINILDDQIDLPRNNIILVGNKNDLADKRSVSFIEGQAKAISLNIHFREISCLDYQQVEEIFVTLLKFMTFIERPILPTRLLPKETKKAHCCK